MFSASLTLLMPGRTRPEIAETGPLDLIGAVANCRSDSQAGTILSLKARSCDCNTVRSGYPMKILGIIFILAAIPAWAYVAWWMNHFCAPAGGWDVCYELGSVAWPYPPLLRAARLFGFLGPLSGLAFLGFDFIQRKRRTPRRPGRTLNL
jgi:hypothetical protein